MKSSNILTFLLFTALTAGCGGGGGSGAPPANSGGGEAASNVLAVTIGNNPLPNSYSNEPTVSVTVCAPDTSKCQTIDNILLDTGSYGLRIFKQALPPNISLSQVTVLSAPLAECVTYADGFGNWGPVQIADVVLGGETASNVPIQIIDATYVVGAIPAACQSPNVILDQSPGSAGYNGILGVGLFASDCGHGCSGSADNGIYFTCSESKCVGAAVPLTSQVQNPVALLKQDNNGVIVKLPPVSLGGVPSVTGQLILGIGTRSNNAPSGVIAYPADNNGEFTTVFKGATLSNSFIDSGSNGLFFNDPSGLLPLCQGWYCPPATQSFTATTTGADGSPSVQVNFSIGNATNLFNSVSNGAFAELGGSAPPGSGFDWGLPFFFGRAVYVGIEGGKGSTLGSGPYWAY